MSFRQAIHTLELLDMQTRALITQISVRIIKKQKNKIIQSTLQCDSFFKTFLRQITGFVLF